MVHRMFREAVLAEAAQDFAEYADDPQEWFLRGFSRGWSAARPASALVVEPALFEDALHVMFGKGGNGVVADIMAALRAAVTP